METHLQTLDRSTQPPVQKIGEIPGIDVAKDTLRSGLPVYTVHDPGNEVIKLEIVFSAGSARQLKPLQAAFTNDLFDAGTNKLNAFQIAEKLDYYGSYLESSMSKDFASVTLYCLTKFFEPSLIILSEVLKECSFPEEEFEIHRNNSLLRFKINDEKVDVLARREFSRLLFNKHSAYHTRLDEKDYQLIEKKDLNSFYQTNYLGGCLAVFLSGNTQQKDIDFVKSSLGFLSKINKTKGQNIKPGETKTVKLQKDGAVQTGIRMGRVLFNMAHEDYFGMQVLNTVFGGYFGSRLMANIREDKGYTYGIGSAVMPYKYSGVFFLVTEVGKEVAVATIAEINKEIDVLQNELISEPELELVKNYMLGRLLKKTDGAFARLNLVKKSILHGLPTLHYRAFEEAIKTTKADQLRDLAQKYLPREGLSSVMAGDFK